MGLSVEVGSLAGVIGADEEGEEWLRRDFKLMNQVLKENKLPQHEEPESIGPLDNRLRLVGLSYSWIHYLRRIQAHLWEDKNWVPTPVTDKQLNKDHTADNVIVNCDMRLHLLCHSDCEGYYLPIDFPEALMDFDKERIKGGMLGSSVRLMAELVALAKPLGIPLRGGKLSKTMADKLNKEISEKPPFWIERTVWFSLFEAARLSLEHKTAIRFS